MRQTFSIKMHVETPIGEEVWEQWVRAADPETALEKFVRRWPTVRSLMRELPHRFVVEPRVE